MEESKNIYFDQQFINNISEIENSKFSQLINFVVEGYSYEINHEKLTNISKSFQSIFGNDKNPLTIYRKLKSLIHSCVYNRFSKKFKTELLNLGLKQEKVEILCEIVKVDLENLNEKLKTSEFTSYLKDFEIKTEMPVLFTNYKVLNEETQNQDYKKQSIDINLIINENNENKEIFFEMNKSQLVNFHEEIEKIQEKLDKLY